MQPRVGIGACLAGHKVRYQGDSKKSSEVLRLLESHFDLRPHCPEVDIGLGVPRETLRLVGEVGAERVMDSSTQSKDVTPALEMQADAVFDGEQHLCGYILVKGSPSCGLERVKRYGESGQILARDGRGAFARRLLEKSPHLPVEEDGRLNDPALCESFVCRVYAMQEWHQLCSEGLSLHRLQTFYARYKYLVMAHDVKGYRQLGLLLANRDKRPLATLADNFIARFMDALKKPANRKSYSNALYHIAGYLRKVLPGVERAALRDMLEHYRLGVVPLIAPLTLLRHYFALHPSDYMSQQRVLQPCPMTLGIHNSL